MRRVKRSLDRGEGEGLESRLTGSARGIGVVSNPVPCIVSMHRPTPQKSWFRSQTPIGSSGGSLTHR